MKIRNGFVSNSSSSSFVIGTSSQLFPTRHRKGNSHVALDWLKGRLRDVRGVFSGSIFCNSDEVDYRWENNKVVEYMGCCDYCYGPFTDWTESEFLEKHAHDKFTFSNE